MGSEPFVLGSAVKFGNLSTATLKAKRKHLVINDKLSPFDRFNLFYLILLINIVKSMSSSSNSTRVDICTRLFTCYYQFFITQNHFDSSKNKLHQIVFQLRHTENIKKIHKTFDCTLILTSCKCKFSLSIN